ncbi:hypothetical protein ABEB36_013557 [Hypothenemus hampei]|uniref:Uncharacterized protein n=1 Tax=Hypothenemus hampei TaxID=57062 RepID=A0ABD1E4J6_HYPHA
MDINDWFDIFNSRVPESDSRSRKKVFRLELAKQLQIIDQVLLEEGGVRRGL